MKDPFRHALQVLEYDRIREVLSSYCLTGLGRQVAACLEPLRDPKLLRRRLKETGEMSEWLRTHRLPLAGAGDVSSEIRSLKEQGRPAEAGLFQRVLDALHCAASLRQALGVNPVVFPLLAEKAERLQDVPELREGISRTIDSEGVRDTATPRLSELRREIHELRASLRGRAQAILAGPALRRSFQSEGVTVKDDRFLLPVKAEYRSSVPGPIRDRSQSGATLYIEPEAIVLDGDRLLELLDEERDEVLRILWDLTRGVLAALKTLEENQRVLAWADFTAAKASYAAAFGLHLPVISTDRRLELRQARHPYLLWLARDARRDHREIDLDAVHRKVVPLDMHLDDRTPILIVTGPNTGGKTVALKTIGLNVLLALSGVPVAAGPGSRVPHYSDVFVDIGDEQSIEQNLSTFSSHLKQVVEVLRSAGPRSLILLDELGSGTDPLEGAALGKALLDHFRQHRWCAVITTHLGSLKEYAYLHEGAENAAMEFDERTLRPTYRMLMGVAGSSNALSIARRLGVRPEIVEAAEREIAAREEPTREIISRMEASRRRAEKERRRAERLRQRAQGEARAAAERAREVEARQEALDLEAEVEVDGALRAVKEELEPLIERLKNVPQAHRRLVDELEARLDVLLTRGPLGAKREAFARSLRKDDEVYVPKFRSRGRVRRINKTERLLTVVLGGKAVELSFDDVSWLEGPQGSPGE